MGTTFYFQWEVDLMIWLQQFMNAGMLLLAKLLTMLGGEVVLVGILVILYLGYDKKMGVFIGTNVVMALTLAPQIKNLVFRRRPYFDHHAIKCLAPVHATEDLYSIEAQGFSFPSMHSANAMTVYGSIALWIRKKWLTVLLFLLAIGVGISRVCVGVHYPTDVLTGWGIALLILLVMPRLQEKVTKKWQLYLGMLLISLPGLFFAQTNDYFNGLGVMCGFFAGVLFEEKRVNFENTKNVWHILLRLVFAMAIFGVLYLGSSRAFSGLLTVTPVKVQQLFRALRFFICVFVIMGPYPLIFKKWHFLS